MRFSSILLFSLLLASGLACADDKSEKQAPAAKSDKNVFQKAESSVGDWANRNKIWVTRKKKSEKEKKSEKARKD